MIKFRTISQLIKVSILPEIEKRIQEGTISATDLPIELNQFRIIQRKLSDGNILPIIELNQEVSVVAKVEFKRSVSPGKSLTLDDIYPEKSFIEPPIYNGEPAAYFLCKSLIFDYMLIFDCRPNLPGFLQEELEKAKIRYPILVFVNAKKYLDFVRPFEKLKNLSVSNWPPAPGYYPQVLLQVHRNPTIVQDEAFIEIVSDSYNRDYWNTRIDFWKETDFFPKRLHYIRRALDAHFQQDYICSIYVIVPQFEGIIKDYLTKCGITPPNGFVDCVKELKKLILSRKVLLFPREIFETIFEYLEAGSFWKNTRTISDPTAMVNRHGIVHGLFTGFECKEISLKYLILFDALSFVLLHDKILTHSL